MKYSIITPTYKRIDQVINNTKRWAQLNSYELIIINDNPKDKLTREMFDQKMNIRVYNNNKNIGLSATRNKGIDLAKGEYIYFLDDDDQATQEFIDYLNSHDVTDEILRFKYKKINKNNKMISIRYFPMMRKIHKLDWFSIPGASSYLIKRSFLQNNKSIRFPENCYYEDILFSQLILENISKKQRIINIYSRAESTFKRPTTSILRQEYKMSFLDDTYVAIDKSAIKNKDFIKKIVAMHNLFSKTIQRNKYISKMLIEIINSFPSYFTKLPLYFKMILIQTKFKKNWK